MPVMTAYRQEAIACARMLQAAGQLAPRDLAAASPRAAAILQRNVYGWFVRIERGRYEITAAGVAALARYDDAGG